MAAAPPPFDTAAHAGRDDPRKERDEVESPSISAPHALARFEFESGRGNEGTKILMIEWDDDEHTRDGTGEWHITWDGMRTVLPAAENDSARIADGLEPGADAAAAAEAADAAADNDEAQGKGSKKTIVERGGSHRMYFLLQPGVVVPPIVTLTYRPDPKSDATEIVWHTNPLPAIFPPELGASARTAGRKGVLHTIWAKQRVRTLQREISEESQSNVESVGLTMAVQEKEWIEENFGVAARASVSSAGGLPLSLQTASAVEGLQNAPRSPGPASPRSPGGSRLQQKLQGLRLGTTEGELASPGIAAEQNPLSPETGDVAVSSFAAIKGERATPFDLLSSLAAKPAQQPRQQQQQAARKIAPARPPESLVREQQSMSSFGGFASMAPPPSQQQQQQGKSTASTGGKDDDEDLFALPISPRSPEMSKSPFSFASEDTQRHGQAVRGKVS